MKVYIKSNKEKGIVEISDALFYRKPFLFEKVEEKKEEKEKEMTKSELIKAILEKYGDDYSEEELKTLKKDVLVMTLKGEV